MRLHGNAPRNFCVVRSDDWKLQHNARQNRYWLFNLAEDPSEQVNLAKSHPDKLAELDALIRAHWADARDPLYAHTTQSPVCIDKSLADLPCEDDNYVIWPN